MMRIVMNHLPPDSNSKSSRGRIPISFYLAENRLSLIPARLAAAVRSGPTLGYFFLSLLNLISVVSMMNAHRSDVINQYLQCLCDPECWRAQFTSV